LGNFKFVKAEFLQKLILKYSRSLILSFSFLTNSLSPFLVASDLCSLYFLDIASVSLLKVRYSSAAFLSGKDLYKLSQSSKTKYFFSSSGKGPEKSSSSFLE